MAIGTPTRTAAQRQRAPELRDDLVARSRLFGLLDRSLRSRLLLVSAPPGFGKTTALASWLAARRIPSAWLSIESGDNDRARFARGLREAFGVLCAREETTAGENASAIDLHVLIERLIEPLSDAGEHRILVLDDYHLVELPAIHDAVAFLVGHAPPALHVAIATRADPPFPLARLRASHELVELRAEDLRFDEREARAFVSASPELAIPDADLAVLLARTEGWIAGLKLAALSLRGRSDVGSFVRDFSGTHRFILDYLVEEVLLRQQAEVQSFLLQTSVLELLDAGSCDALTGRSDGQHMLELLERSNLFTIPLDPRRERYRYHHLFAELLRARLRQTDAGAERRLRARASEWYEEQGELEDAIRQAAAARDVERTLRLLEQAWARYVLLGEFDAFRRWLDALPREAVDRHPILCAARAWIPIVQGHVGEIEQAVREVEAALERNEPNGDPAVRSTIPAQLALMRGSAALLVDRDTDRALALADEARLLLPPDLPAPLRTIFDGMIPLQAGHARHMRGELAASADAYREAIPHLWASENTLGVAEATMHLAQVEEHLGHRGAAIAACTDTLARANDAGLAAAGALAAVYLALAEIHLSVGERDASTNEAREALDRGRLMGSVSMVAQAQALLARLALASTAITSLVALPEPLTARELEILHLLAAGRSNRQIAEELVVALGTVKAHVHAVCAKLDAASRLEAVARARELGLLN